MPPSARAFAFAIPLAIAACPAERDDGAGSLVVGVQSDDFGALVGAVRVVVKREGVVEADETAPLVPGARPPLAKEIAVTGAAGERVEVTAEAIAPGGGPPLVTRTASTRLPSGGKRLLRVHVDRRCLGVAVSNETPPVTCAEPLTCVAGRCAPPEVSDADLEDYEPSWATSPPDFCRPARRGPPEVMLGTGQTAYAPLAEGQLLELERGSQGGHHVWVAVRMRNLRQSGSTTAITSRIVDDPKPVPSVAYVFTYDRDEGSYCAIWGLRYQIDAGEANLREAYKRFLGKSLVVTVEVRDSGGGVAADTRTVRIADTILCPDGTATCNQP